MHYSTFCVCTAFCVSQVMYCVCTYCFVLVLLCTCVCTIALYLCVIIITACFVHILVVVTGNEILMSNTQCIIHRSPLQLGVDGKLKSHLEWPNLFDSNNGLSTSYIRASHSPHHVKSSSCIFTPPRLRCCENAVAFFWLSSSQSHQQPTTCAAVWPAATRHTVHRSLSKLSTHRTLRQR